MEQLPEQERSERQRGASERAEAGTGERRLFPWNTVVGVIDDPDELERVVRTLTTAGFDESAVDVLCGASGAQRIDVAGKRKGLLGRLFRMVDVLGSEREHTERHLEELAAGHFLVVVPSEDEATTERIRDILAAHGGHFIYYYSRWTAKELMR